MDTYLSIGEVSTLLNIKRPTLYQWVESGQIPHYKLGRLIRFRRHEIIQWMERHKAAPVDVPKRARDIMKKINHPTKDMKNLLKKTLDGIKSQRYTSNHTENQTDSQERGC